MSIEERVVNLEQAFLALNRLAKRADERHESVSQNINLLTELIRRHDAKLGEIEAEQSNADVRIAALADAQIRTEQALTRLAESQARTDEKLAQRDERLNSLIGVVERLISERGDKGT